MSGTSEFFFLFSLYNFLQPQASLGEVKDEKAANKVPIRLKIGGKNFVIGTLSAGDRPQIMFDLVFEKEFELSHDWKNGSVYFIGYQTMDPCLYPSILSFFLLYY